MFNDIFINTNVLHPWANGINLVIPQGPVHVWNNTVLCPSTASSGMQISGGNGIDFRNNVQTGCDNFFNTSNAGAMNATITTMDYNLYASFNSAGNPAFAFLTRTSGEGSLATQFASWQGITQALVSGSEADSLSSSSAMLDSKGVPQVASPVINAGVNLCYGVISCTGTLTALSSSTSAGNTINPVSRPPTGAWTIGAYQYSAGGSALSGVSASGATIQ